MWAQRLIRPGLLETVEVHPPLDTDLRAGSVLVRTLAGGICGSDIPKFRGHKGAVTGPAGEFLPRPPGFPMHEVVGEVVATRHPDVDLGDHVVGWAVASDGLAEFVITDGEQVNTYDPGLEPRRAVLIQSLACVLYALGRLDVANKDVAVIGLGPVGAMFAHALKERGARRVTGIDPIDRSSMSPTLGLDETIPATGESWASSVRGGDQPGVTIEAVGHQVGTLNDAIVGTAPEGTILYFGIPDEEIYPVNVELLLRKNLTLVGGITRHRRQSLAAGNRYLQKQPHLYDALVWHEFDRGTAQEAYDVAARPASDRLKVVLSLA